MVEQFVSPVCARIRATREQLRQEALANGDKDRARELTQQGMAGQLHLSIKAYAAYEKDREPAYARRLEIARAMGLAPAFFESAPPDEAVRSLQEELAAVRGEMAGLRREIAALREVPAGQPEAPPQAESS